MPDPPDPYVKMYLLPARKSKSKRKSDVKKDTVNPVFEETFKAVNISETNDMLFATKLHMELFITDN